LRKILYVTHNHSSIRPGGLETYAEELYQGVRTGAVYEPFLVARSPVSAGRPQHAGTRFALVGEDPNVYFMATSPTEFDSVLWRTRDKRLHTRDWRGFLRTIQPDVIHFHHSAWLGYEMLQETRTTLPHVPIVYTLHEFVPMCHHFGQMVRTGTLELCERSSPRRCHQCFPAIPIQRFFLRERFIRFAFEHVDMFLAPSELLRQRFITWGIQPQKILYEDNGRLPVVPLADPPDAGRRRRIGFIGQLAAYKGVDVLLEAMKILALEGVEVQLLLWGANLEHQADEFQHRVVQLLEETAGSVRFAGRYEQASLPSLLSAVDWVVVPSIWWENAPLVIQEAMMHRRPVICSDIGGMAEKVRHGIDGLHFRVRDPDSLARTISRAISSPGLWDELRSHIVPPYPMETHVTVLSTLYDQLRETRTAELAMA
jgi:glycosyltransferase involved in cell wall biosynthesis